MSKEVTKRKTAADIRAEERAKRTNTDRLLLKYARRSLEEISEKTGLEPAEAAQRLEHLLRERDFLSERQQERLLIIELGDLVDSVRGRMESAGEDNYADIANVALRGYEAIAKRLDARRKLTEADISEITRAQGEMFLAIIVDAVNKVATRLEEIHPDSEWDIRLELEEAFAIALPEAREEVARRVRE